MVEVLFDTGDTSTIRGLFTLKWTEESLQSPVMADQNIIIVVPETWRWATFNVTATNEIKHLTRIGEQNLGRHRSRG